MDTYFTTNGNCVSCGRCVKACNTTEWKFLYGHRDDCPHERHDNPPCHLCSDRFSRVPPCQVACHYDAIKITRN